MKSAILSVEEGDIQFTLSVKQRDPAENIAGARRWAVAFATEDHR
jgi:hypothetical protein